MFNHSLTAICRKRSHHISMRWNLLRIKIGYANSNRFSLNRVDTTCRRDRLTTANSLHLSPSNIFHCAELLRRYRTKRPRSCLVRSRLRSCLVRGRTFHFRAKRNSTMAHLQPPQCLMKRNPLFHLKSLNYSSLNFPLQTLDATGSTLRWSAITRLHYLEFIEKSFISSEHPVTFLCKQIVS